MAEHFVLTSYTATTVSRRTNLMKTSTRVDRISLFDWSISFEFFASFRFSFGKNIDEAKWKHFKNSKMPTG